MMMTNAGIKIIKKSDLKKFRLERDFSGCSFITTARIDISIISQD